MKTSEKRAIFSLGLYGGPRHKQAAIGAMLKHFVFAGSHPAEAVGFLG